MKRFLSGGWLSLFAITLVLVGSISFLSLAQTAKAAGTATYTLFYSDADKEDLKAIFDDGEKQEEIGNKMVVAAKGGLFGDAGYNLVFSSAVNQQLNAHGTGDDDDSDEYFAVAPVYCSGDTISLDTPTTKPYFKLDYVLGFNINDWNAVESGTSYKTYGGITKVTKISGSGVASDTLHVKKEGTGVGNLGDMDANHNGEGDRLDKIGVSSACLSALSRGDLGNKTRNYWKLTDAEKLEVDAIVASGGTATVEGSESAETGTTCQGGALGWLFCPFVNAMAGAVQTAAKLIDKLMQVRFLANQDSSTAIETAWRSFLSLANILLVIAFLIIILSQATSMGLSNYNIKRMLPRLVIAAILMNISFYICAFAIDVSNIVGGSIIGFLVGDGASVGSAITEATGGEGGSFIAGAVATGAIVIALAFFAFIPVVLSIMLVFITLVGRQVILMCLVLVSPLAFVAWLLPNTEKYFKKWYELFFQMLVLYPMVMLVFGASLYLAKLVGAPGSGLSVFGG